MPVMAAMADISEIVLALVAVARVGRNGGCNLVVVVGDMAKWGRVNISN